jgi:hypothetical protein
MQERKNIQNTIDQDLEKLKLVSSRLQLKVEVDKYNNNNNNNIINNTESQYFITRITNLIKSEIKSFEDIFILDPDG